MSSMAGLIPFKRRMNWFLTNRQDQQQLMKPAYRQRIVEALLSGVLQYQQALKTGTKKVAQQ